MKFRNYFGFRNIWVCVACDLKFSRRETIAVHSKLHEDEFDVEKVTLTNTTCPECNSVSMQICMLYLVYLTPSLKCVMS